MDRQRRQRPARTRPFPPPAPPITSPSERPPRRPHGRAKFSPRPTFHRRPGCARVKPSYGRGTNVLSTPDLGIRYTDKAGTLHELTSRKAAIFPVF